MAGIGTAVGVLVPNYHPAVLLYDEHDRDLLSRFTFSFRCEATSVVVGISLNLHQFMRMSMKP